MKEYTIIAVVSVFAVCLLDARNSQSLLRRKEFLAFLLIILFFKLLVNGFLTGSGIVLYNEQFCSGWRIGSIPIEDFLFGFSMVMMTIFFWEHFKAKAEHLR